MDPAKSTGLVITVLNISRKTTKGHFMKRIPNLLYPNPLKNLRNFVLCVPNGIVLKPKQQQEKRGLELDCDEYETLRDTETVVSCSPRTFNMAHGHQYSSSPAREISSTVMSACQLQMDWFQKSSPGTISFLPPIIGASTSFNPKFPH